MKRLGLATTLGLAAGLAACGKPQAAAPLAPATTPAAASDMANMDMSAGAKMAKGSGTVTAVDTKAGTITLDHGPIPEANWPAMTMTFKAAPAVTSAVKTGDKVDFDVKIQGGAGEVTAVRRP
jgi:Cu(I)/Ag(I) efflux system protein CusF